MRVYDVKGFANPARVRIALAEKNLYDDVEFVPVDVMNGEHRTPEFLKKNPSGVVPVLELPCGTCISECTAITEYLDHATGQPVLTGLNPRERGVIHMMQRKVEAGLLDAISHYFHHATEGLGPNSRKVRNMEWGRQQLGTAFETMRWMNQVLEDRQYLAGDRFTVADITAMGAFAFADAAGVKMPEGLDHLAAWRERVFARPSAALAA
jgi:glutathione S-transferase